MRLVGLNSAALAIAPNVRGAIIAKLAGVLEVEPAELLRVPEPKDDLDRWRDKLNR